ncbi:MAG: sigma-70 family RNA polymerase sigma factor [Phycisphaeraceae bacterium]|nr:sigma-70 family RNA polymerase sigma factor [Phycisphaeraceae bacterium]MCW5755193.1 sigma-70 family RNA polymerase sigma factor [Phycisphaeraceae bacterium]
MSATPTPRPTPRPAIGPPEAQSDDAYERELVARIRAGRQEAWGELLERYQDRLYTICFRMVHHRELAADLTQDAMIKIMQGLESYDGRAKLSTWIIRITMNVCLSRLRAEKIRRHASLDASESRDGYFDPGGGRPAGRRREREHFPGTSVEHSDLRATLARALECLGPDQRAILILRDVRGLDYEQIAEVLGLAGGTVKSRLFRARAALRDAMETLGRSDGHQGDERTR